MTVVARLGAFAETCLAVERSHTAGLRVGANVFVTKRNLPLHHDGQRHDRQQVMCGVIPIALFA
jgi:hypothetical protein